LNNIKFSLIYLGLGLTNNIYKDINMKIVLPMLIVFTFSGCVSFKPLEIDNYKSYIDKSGCSSPASEICIARNYASSTSLKYRTQVINTYKDNEDYDTWILNLFTLGIGAEVANLHSDVLKSAAISLGYQSARKTYQSIPFQLQVYTNAITAAQCVYDNSSRLSTGYSFISELEDIHSDLSKSIAIFDSNVALLNQLIDLHLKDLGSYETLRPKLVRARELASKSSESLSTSASTVVQAIQRIDITILKRFNGQLPDITEISAQLRKQISENIELEERGTVSELPQESTNKLSLDKASPPVYSFLQPHLNDALNSINKLSRMRVERYITDANLVKACSATI
jgi:hypothetical protein